MSSMRSRMDDGMYLIKRCAISAAPPAVFIAMKPVSRVFIIWRSGPLFVTLTSYERLYRMPAK